MTAKEAFDQAYGQADGLEYGAIDDLYYEVRTCYIGEEERYAVYFINQSLVAQPNMSRLFSNLSEADMYLTKLATK